jgi:AmmeMemoRadiSam system protein B
LESNLTPNPSLRDSIDLQLIQDGADRIIYITCKLGISEPLALIAAVGPILRILNGTRSLDEIKIHFSQQGVKEETITRVLQLLDDNYYLASSRFHQRKQEVLEAFRATSVRPAAHAGRVYSNNGDVLNKYLKKTLLLEKETELQNEKRKLAVVVAPHIDYQRGHAGYAKAYQLLAYQKPDICIVIGTSHQPGRSLFQLTNKDFACPNGTLIAQKDFIESLLGGYGHERGLADELLHRQEHSLELQIPFLNHLCPNTKIVPILVGSFYSYLREKQAPENDSEYKDFVDILSKTIKQHSDQGSHVAIIAGVDMAHVGQNFGDSFRLESEKLLEIETEDKFYLDTIKLLSSKKMFAHIAKDYDQRRICGFPTMHCILDVLAKLEKSYEVDLRDYQQAIDQKTQCLVSFAALGIFESITT